MARAHLKRKNRGGRKDYTCGVCHEKIQPGDRYYTWSFRYGGTYYQHAKHGMPRQSQLTQSKMSEVYAAIENVEDLLGSPPLEPGGSEIEDLKNALEEVANTATEIAGEYTEAAEPFGGQGENQERAEGLESFASDVEQAAGSLSETWDDAREEAEQAIGEVPS